jgi:hypothetical protein
MRDDQRGKQGARRDRLTHALTCGFGARGRIRTDDLPITSRMLGVDPVGSRRIWPAHVGCVVDLVGSRRIQTDRLDDHRDDQKRIRHYIGCRCLASDTGAGTIGEGSPGKTGGYAPSRSRVVCWCCRSSAACCWATAAGLSHRLSILAFNLVSSPRLATTSHRPRNGLRPAQTQPEVRSGVTVRSRLLRVPAQIGQRRTR